MEFAEVTAYFLTWCAKDGIFEQICGFSGLLYVQWTTENKRTENIWVATYACHNDHYDESSLGYQLTLISPAHCYQKSLPLLSSVDGEENFRVSFLVFFHIISHCYLILPKISCKLLLTKVSMQNIKLPNLTQIRLDVTCQVCLWNH